MTKRIILCFFIFLFMLKVEVRCEEVNTIINGQMDILGIDEISEKTKEILNDNNIEFLADIDLETFITKLINGEESFSMTEILDYIFKTLFNEIYQQIYSFKRIIFIIIISALLKNINSSFKGKSISELSFYICYMVMVFTIMEVFSIEARMVIDVIFDMSDFVKVVLPSFVAIQTINGQVSESVIIAPFIFATSQFIMLIIKNIVIPAITSVTILEMINNLSDKSLLNHLTELFKDIISVGMRGIAFIFIAVLSLQKIGSGTINGMFGKTIKNTVSAVPVVGSIMTSAVETATGMTRLLGNGVSVVAIIVVVIIALIPIFKLVAMIFIYKFAAAVSEPICEERLINCINSAGNFSMLLLGCLFTAEVMFIFSFIIFISLN